MPVYATRKLRNLAAGLMFLSGFTHAAQLWLFDIDGPSIVGALVGAFYLIIALGLAGGSRFTLWIGIFIPAASGTAALLRYMTLGGGSLTLFHVTIDVLVIVSCAYILARTRHVGME